MLLRQSAFRLGLHLPHVRHASTHGSPDALDVTASLCQAADAACSVADLSSTRGVIRMAGADVLTFLQGLLTNDVSALAAPEATPLYAAILNPQGRLLQDMFLHRQTGQDVVLLADVHSDGIPDLLRLLKRFKMRAAVDIADVSDSYTAWARFGSGILLDAGAENQTKAWPRDPRLNELGRRAVVDTECGSNHLTAVADAAKFRSWRIELGIAEGPEEMPAGDAIPLEYNLDALHGISFDKGCYVGQELVARAHWSGTVRKRLMPFALHPTDAVAIGSAVECEGVKRPVGAIRVLNTDTGRGLSILRLEQGLAAAAGKGSLHIKGRPSQQLQPWQPTWWSSDMLPRDTA